MSDTERRVPRALQELREENEVIEAGSRAARWRSKRERAESATNVVAGLFVVAILSAVGLLIVYVQGGQTQLEGLLLFAAWAALGIGLGVWVKVVIDEPQVVEERELMSGAVEEREAFSQAFSTALGAGGAGGRRRFLLRLLGGTGAAMAAALFIPLRSLGPGPSSELFFTSWVRGKRVVDGEGEPLLLTDIVRDQVVTVYPEDDVGSADAQALLIGLREERSADLAVESPEGIACYSKICTHAGCPVGLYRARDGELICPCHQSTFDVYDSARPLSGPTGRDLPGLPIGVDDDGFLIALGDFNEPVGPGFWNLNDEPERLDAASRSNNGEDR